MERALQPAPRRQDESGRAAAAAGDEFVEQRVDMLRVVEGGDSTTEKERQRDPPELDDVGPLIKPHPPLSIVERKNSELRPCGGEREAKRVERAAEHVLQDHQLP